VSYDLTFIRRRPWQTWSQALAVSERAAAVIEDLTDQDIDMWRRLHSRLLPELGDQAQVQVREDRESFELVERNSTVSVHLFHGEAAVTVPYSAVGDDARTTVNLMYRLAAVVEQETGLHGYDPQLESGVSDFHLHSASGQCSSLRVSIET
jgi:hypothetical protein